MVVNGVALGMLGDGLPWVTEWQRERERCGEGRRRRRQGQEHDDWVLAGWELAMAYSWPQEGPRKNKLKEIKREQK